MAFTSRDEFVTWDPSSFTKSTGISLTRYRLDTDQSTLNAISILKTVDDRYLQERFPPTYISLNSDVLGDLAQNCVDQQDFVDVNTLGFINELRDIGSLIPKIGSIKNPKTWASAWLCFKYGLRLTAADTAALTEGIISARQTANAVGPRVVRSSKSMITNYHRWSANETYRYKLTYDEWPSDIMSTVGALRRWNIWPKLSTAWDMIPMSFVVDWAVDVESLLSRLDHYMDVQYFNVLSCCWSRKSEMTIPASEYFFDLPILGQIQFVLYERRVEPILRQPRLRIDKAGQFRNYLELASLIVVRG